MLEPGDGGGVSVDEEDFFGFQLADVLEDALPGGVAAEAELLDGAADGLGGGGGIEGERDAGGGGADAAGGRFRVGIADEEEGMLGAGEDALGECVGEGFFGHHAAGEGVDAAGLDGGLVGTAACEDKGGGGVEDLHLGMEPGCGLGEAVVDFGEFCAEAADVDGAIGDLAATAEIVEHHEQFLGFAEGKERHDDGATPGKGGGNGGGETFFLVGPGKAGRGLVVAAGGLDDQDVDPILGEAGGAGDGLIVEIDVAGVEDRTALRAEEDAGGPEDMAGIEELEGDVLAAGGAVAREGKGAVEGDAAPLVDADIDLAVGEEGVLEEAIFLALAAHHVDGIVEHDLAEGGSGLRGEDGCARVPAGHYRQGADMIVMRVGEKDGFGGGASAEAGEVREGEFTLALGVHAGVEDDVMAGQGQGVAIGTDLDMAREI